MGRNKKKSSLDVGYFAVAFIDVMGQQEQLRKLTSLPKDKGTEEYDELVSTLKSTYGVVSGMRKVFTEYFVSFGNGDIDLKGFPIEKRINAKHLVNNPIRTHLFSDFMVAFLSLAENKGAKLPARGIHAILGASAATSLISLASGHPVRGGIDIGVGIELSYKEVYGAPLARAYALESHVAGYPRIVIGAELSNYLIHLSKHPEQDEVSVISSHTANLCLDLIAMDDDGYSFVDFMGEGIYKQIGDQDWVPDIIQKAYNFVIKSSVEFQEKKNTKIAFKYTLLRNYMESRLPIWGLRT